MLVKCLLQEEQNDTRNQNKEHVVHTTCFTWQKGEHKHVSDFLISMVMCVFVFYILT